MLSRALIVLLIVLNLGVALWWATRSDAPAPEPQAASDGVPRLQLLSEPPRIAPAAPPIATTSPPPEQSPVTDAADAASGSPAPERCYAFGPFDDAAKAEAARTRLQTRVARVHLRTETTTPAGAWRVWLPPQPDRAAAQALAARIAAAGFSDYFIVSAGSEANAIALGRYNSETTARTHAAALQAAGFADVRAEPIGAADARRWVDVAAGAGLDLAAERTALGGVGAETVDCSRVP